MDYHLLSRGHWRSGVATVEQHNGHQVPMLLWASSRDCETALNRYEGWLTLYLMEILLIGGITCVLNDIRDMPAEVTEFPTIIYIMNQGHPEPPSVG